MSRRRDSWNPTRWTSYQSNFTVTALKMVFRSRRREETSWRINRLSPNIKFKKQVFAQLLLIIFSPESLTGNFWFIWSFSDHSTISHGRVPGRVTLAMEDDNPVPKVLFLISVQSPNHSPAVKQHCWTRDINASSTKHHSQNRSAREYGSYFCLVVLWTR